MQLTEAEIKQIIDDWMYLDDVPFDEAPNAKIGGANLAAHAIAEAEKMREGVVWEGEGNNRGGWPWIDSNKGRTDLAEAFKKLDDGQSFHVVFTVTVTKAGEK